MTDFAVTRSCYGREPFDVIRVVGQTAKTHTIVTRDWQGKWGRPTRVVSIPDYPAMGLSQIVAEVAAKDANAAWLAKAQSVTDAKSALEAAQEARVAAAIQAIAEAIS